LRIVEGLYDDEYQPPKHLSRQPDLPGLSEGEGACVLEDEMVRAGVCWITAGLHMVNAPCEVTAQLNKSGVAQGIHLMVVPISYEPAWGGVEATHKLDTYQARDIRNHVGARCMAKWYQPCDDGSMHWFAAIITHVYQDEPRYGVVWEDPGTYGAQMACRSNEIREFKTVSGDPTMAATLRPRHTECGIVEG